MPLFKKIMTKIFWGFILGLGILYFKQFGNQFFGGFFKIISSIKILDINVCIRGIHFIGPLFGVFVGIVIGASSNPFSVKKLLICILAGFLGGLAYSIQILLSARPDYIQSLEMFGLSIFTLALMPFAIGIADKSVFKVGIGLIGEGIGIVFFLFSILFGFGLSKGELFGLGKIWGVIPVWAHIIFGIIVLVSAIVTLIGIEASELKRTVKD